MSAKSNYRPDIDGLRAVAVLAVLFYHAELRFFSGGYVGVDIFFVISGFLITGILVREIQGNSFSLKNFYERRIRRIFPAVFSVIAGVLLVSTFLYDSSDFSDVGASALSTTWFFSNILFWFQSGYFEGPATLKPLLHTWSLSVEEQFYIFFPLFLLFIHRFLKARYLLWLWVISFLSLTASIVYTYIDPSTAFYFMPLRAWELLAGGILVFIPQSSIRPLLRNILSALGVVLLAASIVLFSEETLFPGLLAFLPVAGTALLIALGDENTNSFTRWLSNRPLVFIGKISYSLYLWHWPILVIGKYYLIREPTGLDILIYLAGTLFISTLSWKYIENPFRTGVFTNTPSVFRFATTAMLISTGICGVIYLNRGFPNRFTTIASISPIEEDSLWADRNRCLSTMLQNGAIQSVDLCQVGSNSTEPSFLLWGDSHARAIAPALDKSAAAQEAAGYVSATTSCPPLLGFDIASKPARGCSQHNETILSLLEAQPHIQTVFLAGRWSAYAEGTRYKSEDGIIEERIDSWTNDRIGYKAFFQLGMERTITRLLELDRTVVIIATVPEVGYDVPSAFSIAVRTNRDLNEIIASTPQEYRERNKQVNDTLHDLQVRDGIQIIDPSNALCSQTLCYVVLNNQPLYRDDDHLSTYGAQYISYLFDSVFKQSSYNE